MRVMSREGTRGLADGYGDPMGFAPLRKRISLRMADLGIDAPTDQVLLTSGTVGGMDLVGRYLIRPNDLVLVDDPGWYHTFGHLRALGATVQGVPWTDTGPDLERLEDLAKTWHPRLYVTTPIVHNPTGHSISQGNAFRLLRLAERYDFYIIEDDVDALVSSRAPTPARRPGPVEQGHLRERLFQDAVAAAFESVAWWVTGISFRILST